mmetsp:Transcript_96545/g.278682  ORF Transcript_96545/g.278682 Transcript_96545/m.278682 type:complete len:287 (-) Transcript_96545:92-952(-)
MPHLLVERLRSVPLPCYHVFVDDKVDLSASPSSCRPRPSGSVDCVVESVETVANVIFFVASLCFLPRFGEDVHVFMHGCVLFIVGGILLLALSVFTSLEAFRTKGWASETFEAVLYLVGSFLFTAGTVLYWPSELNHTNIEWMKGHSPGVYLNLFTPEYEGTLLFIAGSLLFAMAAFVNGVNSSAFSKGASTASGRLLLTSVSLYMGGSLLYVVGSIAWLPDIGFGPKAEAFGAWTFVVGSAMYVTGGFLSILRIAGYLGCDAGSGTCGADESSPLVPAAGSPKVA